MPDAIDYRERVALLPDGPLDLSALLPGDGPLELEIGGGRGRFIVERAAAAPSHRILGIEIKAKLVHHTQSRLTHLALNNARVYCGDARLGLHRAGPDGCLARAFILFPDPWWKKRHAKRRVIEPQMLDDLARLLSPGGELFIQTDVEDRAQDCHALLSAHPAFELTGPGGFIEQNPFGARSNREARADADGLPVWRMLATRRSS